MSVDIVKQLDRARRYIEKNRFKEAIEAYLSVLGEVPNHLESIQSVGDLYARLNQNDQAATYYGMLFDRLTAPREEPKALALYTRFLKPTHQPPERVSRYALLLQKQNRTEEAIEQFTAAALAFEHSRRGEDALSCLVRISQMDSDNRDRFLAAAQLAERLGNAPAAARGYLRAGQLTTGNDTEALEFLARAQRLLPHDRSAALLYAQGLLRKGDAAAAAALLAPLAESEKDAAFLDTYADALMRSGQLDGSRAVLDRMTVLGTGSAEKSFALANLYLQAGEGEKAVNLLAAIKKSMLAARREAELTAAVERLVEAYPASLRLAEFCCAMYAELNRESKYFDALIRVFDLHIEAQHLAGARETLEKLVDIDPYDSRNQERLKRLEGRVEEPLLSGLKSRMMSAETHRAQRPPSPPDAAPGGVGELSPAILQDVDSRHTLEDLLVQAEIFVQYSLQSKAIERLQKIVELFPAETEHNERLRGLFEAAHWWPQATSGQPQTVKAVPQDASVSGPGPAIPSSPAMLRDLAKISEINQNIFRQPSPRAMLSAAVNELGGYLRAARCLAVMGAPGQPPQLASEYCAPGMEPSPGSLIVRLIAQFERAAPDSQGGLMLQGAATPPLKEMGLTTALGIQLMDPETQTPSGMLIAGFSGSHAWTPNETYFLQSVGDQMQLSVQHTRLRSLMRTLAVADEKTGLLARSSYLDCLLHESQRARTQGSPLALALLQVDGGQDLARRHGDALFDRYMEQLARTMQTAVRQSDLPVKYAPWALAFILPDTPAGGARTLGEKLMKTAGGVRPPWEGTPLTTSVVVAQAIPRPDFDNEDVVTELINRAEAGLEEASKNGGNVVLSPEAAKI